MEQLDQAKNLISRARQALILASLEAPGDSLGSALALFSSLKKMGKNVNLFVSPKIPEKFRFLLDFQSSSRKDFVISIATSDRGVSKLRYEKDEQGLKIFLTLKQGELKKEDIILAAPKFAEPSPTNIERPDLLVTVGAKSLENFEEFFSQNNKVFSQTPIINIDSNPANEYFGEANLIDPISSMAETTMRLMKSLDPTNALIDEAIATYLLTGVIWASQNFRSSKTRPKTFESSAFLIERGARHQEIIQHLYKQKNVSQIRLLGRVLEKLNFLGEKGLYLISLAIKDFQESQASAQDLGFVLEELQFHFRYLPDLLILWESHASPPLIKGIFYSSNLGWVDKILANFEGAQRGRGVLFLVREEKLDIAQEKVLNVLN